MFKSFKNDKYQGVDGNPSKSSPLTTGVARQWDEKSLRLKKCLLKALFRGCLVIISYRSVLKNIKT